MICITGDVHQASFDNDEQSYLEKSELQTALTYQEIIDSYGFQNTLFVTGKAIDEEPDIAKKLAMSSGLEFGGHTWAAFRPRIVHRLFGFLGDPYGPRPFQSWDVRRTCNKIKSITGNQVRSWRTHAYLSTATTRHVLKKEGIRLISDTVTPTKREPTTTDTEGVLSLPINTLPDHEHIYHGSRTPAAVDTKNEDWSDEFTSESFGINEWLERVKEQIREIERQNGVATILAHPSCMAIADDFDAFERLCSWIDSNDYDTGCCVDAI